MSPAAARRPGWRCNLAEALVDDRLARHATHAALRHPAGVWTSEDLARHVGAIAGGLAEVGAGRGTRVCLALPDSPLWVATFLALARLGAVVALASPHAPPGPLRRAVERAGVTLLVGDDADLAPARRRVDTAMLEHIVRADLPDPGPAATRAADPCYLLLTSGTTGPPKWAVHAHGHIPACLATYGRHILGLGPGDTTWSVAVLPTSYGLGNSLYFPLGAGAASWLTGDPPTPGEAVRACDEGGANVLFGVPTFWSRLARRVADGHVPASAFARVRLAVSAAESLPAAVWHAVRETLGLELVDGLGSSEATNLYASNRPGHARPGSVGHVVPGYELRVVDVAGRPVDAGTAGELIVRGPTIMDGYLDDPVATARAVRDGWLHTGDLVVREPDAGYRFVGRAGERFKSGGLWVDPARVEAALLEHPDVAEVAVTGVADAAGILRVVALVVPRDRSGEMELRARLDALAAAELLPHEAPRDYVVVDALPTAASGKVRRGEIAALAASPAGLLAAR